MLTPGVIKSFSAASGESMIATPLDGSIEPNTSTLMVMPVAGFVTLTLSPGRYPTVFAKSPLGRTPSSATMARPSMVGFDAAKPIIPIDTVNNRIAKILFIIPPSYLIIDFSISSAS